MIFSVFGVRFRRVSGVRRYVKQFYALLVKHAIHSRRNVILTIVQIALPVIFTIFACLVEKTTVATTDPPALPLNLSYFTNPIIVSASGDGIDYSSNGQALQSSYRTVAGAWGQIKIAETDYVDQYLLNVATNLGTYNRYYLIAGKLLF